MLWLARHPRFPFHFTPTSCSWLNAVEGFFARLAKQRLKRGGLPWRGRTPSHDQPLRRPNHNYDPKPFNWTADPDKIIAAVGRGHQVLDSIHQLTACEVRSVVRVRGSPIDPEGWVQNANRRPHASALTRNPMRGA
jgi:hypothetical protein